MMNPRAVRGREGRIGRILRGHGPSMEDLHRNLNSAQEQGLPTHHSGIVAAKDFRIRILMEAVANLIREPITLHYLLENQNFRNTKANRSLETKVLIGGGDQTLESDIMAGSESESDILPAEVLSQNMEHRTLPTGSDNHTQQTGSLRDDNKVRILQMNIHEALQSDMDLMQMLLNHPVHSRWAGTKAILSGNPTKILQQAGHDRQNQLTAEYPSPSLIRPRPLNFCMALLLWKPR
jgi:hypothetical protein